MIVSAHQAERQIMPPPVGPVQDARTGNTQAPPCSGGAEGRDRVQRASSQHTSFRVQPAASIRDPPVASSVVDGIKVMNGTEAVHEPCRTIVCDRQSAKQTGAQGMGANAWDRPRSWYKRQQHHILDANANGFLSAVTTQQGGARHCGAEASGAVASGAVASGAVASSAVASSAVAQGLIIFFHLLRRGGQLRRTSFLNRLTRDDNALHSPSAPAWELEHRIQQDLLDNGTEATSSRVGLLGSSGDGTDCIVREAKVHAVGSEECTILLEESVPGFVITRTKSASSSDANFAKTGKRPTNSGKKP
eukprot:CAMPEP_0181248418 /NCGR_PEP_ID=MMETSP1096-20121128/45156_1 /TAXON_ID=156174 ORGANISM="Chrysochromulina ericina, Strain CCMP281" /NCGR_SAMPLE_ID=MMETSP1096 /ASSEMBLY_ACC=CAM_ASM_000453 /LENGTH=304 /DNA_ID=CAMNT_0023345579 /DNA_START=234 /DNA_END=1149 /DNA_ORIENTATION=-